ncbi:3-hydroxybutyrate dehydrogenase [Pelomonas cellulosilytica]|uniref:3-hydroxybutyrate dehydrogenase n=1 Tax=Pelomonas cellulosilytica TaxID=2906762 RepID=A0ABS8XU04_9BURK|nr:3-hydroxybutyrate dehydrogenase [Pelomonas sp. P8]MCE4554785.1 3-hydroxybutyrate dehydrogenase [Pelomonas sp. P8]
MLNGKTALVTGATSGIGLGIAQTLAAQGANLVINGFGEPAAIEALTKELAQRHGVDVVHSGADMARPADVEAMVAQCVERFGSIDIAVNNAGIQYVSPIEDFPTEQWDRVLAIDLSAAFHLMRVALPHMRTRGWGRIVNIASAHGLVASTTKAAYVAAKHGLIGLTKVAALETATTGITCNAVCPGWVLTPLVQKQIDEGALRDGVSVDEAKARLLAAKQPSLEFATPEQIGGVVAFLCSPAADQIRGATLSVDGGWTAQ